MDLLYFVLFVSILIFIHELGHFAVAKFFGVKVLTFSIGFGPKIVKIRGKETEYCIGVLPFGGFVKMLEERKGETILPEDKARTFESQALYKRILIVLAGPAMNVLFPILLYTSVYTDDRSFLPPTVGQVIPGKPAEGKLQPGDVIQAIEGKPIESFPEVQVAVAKKAGVPLKFTVLRDGTPIDVSIVPVDEVEVSEPAELDIKEYVGRVGIVPSFSAPIIGVARPDSPAYRAGLRTFDRITAINGRKVERFVDLARMLSQNKGDTIVLTYMRPVPVSSGLFDMAVLEPGVAMLTPLSKEESASAPPDEAAREADAFARSGVENSDLYVSFAPEGSSEWRAGLRVGDRIVSLDAEPVRMWRVMAAELVRDPARMHALAWTRDGVAMSGTFQLRKEQGFDEYGQRYARYVFRTTHWLPSAPDVMVPNEHIALYALGKGLRQTENAIQFILVSMLRLVEGRVSLSEVSGPITLYDVAGQAGAKGSQYFAWAMAITSVNLGLINLLPIPVLDGGHLLLFAVEGVRRRPVSLRTREVASLFGMAMLVCLMALAFKNDVTRKWDVIVGQVHEIF